MPITADRTSNYYGKETFFFRKTYDGVSPFCIELAGETFPNSKYHISIYPSDAYVIEYIISGKGTLLFDDIKHPITAGDFCIISSKKKCEYYADPADPYHKIWINCNGNFIRNLCKSFRLDIPFIIHPFSPAQNSICSIHKVLSNSSIPIFEREKACASIMTRLIFDFYEHTQSFKKNSLMDEAVEYINEHICEPINITDIEKNIFISHTHINRLFQKNFNMSPHQYIIHQRISLACSMLEKTSLPISVISSNLSFSNPQYFSYVFKKQTGLSPKEFRSNNFT